MRHGGYWLLGSGLALAIFFALVWGPDILFFVGVGSSIHETLSLGRALFSRAFLDVAPATFVFYGALSLIAGADLALLVYYYRTRSVVSGGAWKTGALGTLVALLGFGCASCGTLFLSLLITSVGGGTIISLELGDQFTWILRGLGLALLAYSVVRLIRHIKDPLVCPAE